MEHKDYLKDIGEIKDIMRRSSRFISLSGLSGVMAGIYALAGATIVYQIIYNNEDNILSIYDTITLIGIACAVVALSVGTGIFLSYKKAKIKGEKIWNYAAKRLLINFLIPLITGGFFIVYLIEKEYWGFLAPMMLIFYGLACVNASNFTLSAIRYLGITLIIIGLITVKFQSYGLYFWAFGFGICHIVYGTLMYYKYDKNS